jgi:hypothetical protein
MATTIQRNSRYQILTPNGWSDFKGISKTIRNDIITIYTENYKLNCTFNHKIKTPNNEFVEAKHLSIGDSVLTSNGIETVTNLIFHVEQESYVYDPINVKKDNTYYSNNIESHNCNQYLGSSGTLIAGWKLQELVPQTPIAEHAGISQYEKPKPNRTYIGIGDVSRGKGLDYSALQIMDVTEMPYQQVLTFRDNTTTPGDFAEIINRIGRQYNNCSMLIEVNDIGQQVAESLYFDYEYESLLFTESAGKQGRRITMSYKSSATDRGIRTTKTVKAIGCSMLKLLIEQNQLLVHDYETIHELSTFSKKNASYEAESGCNDDLVMCLVLFGWLTEQKFFKDLTDINTLLKLKEKSFEDLNDDMLPFGFIDDGNQAVSDDMSYRDDYWIVVDQN